MITKFIQLGAAAVVAAGLATQPASADDGRLFGTIVGAALGGLAGAQIGKGDGKLVAVGTGAVIGGIIGQEVFDARSTRRQAQRDVVVHSTSADYPVYEAPPEPKVVVVERKVEVHHHHHYERPKNRWKAKHKCQKHWRKHHHGRPKRQCHEH